MVTAPDGPPPLPPLERLLGDPWGSLGEFAGQLIGVAAGWGLRLLAVALPVGLVGVAAFLLGEDAGHITAATYDINGGLQVS